MKQDLLRMGLVQLTAVDGARLILVPSAFTAHTGRHSEHRASHGHSMVVGPWGEIVSERAEGEGVLVADLDLNRLEQIRRELPCLQHASAWLLRTSEKGS